MFSIIRSDIEWLGYYNMSKTLPKEDVENGLNSTPHLDNSPWLLVWGYLLVLILLVIQRLLVHYMKGRRSPHVYILRQGLCFIEYLFLFSNSCSRLHPETGFVFY